MTGPRRMAAGAWAALILLAAAFVAVTAFAATPNYKPVQVQFVLCSEGRRTTCVADGDTFWLSGVKFRVADIDTPEVGEPRCAAERQLGMRATNRLRELLNAGPFELRGLPGRDEGGFGRKLRVVTRSGRSLGDQLVREGLARTWTGRREPWC